VRRPTATSPSAPDDSPPQRPASLRIEARQLMALHGHARAPLAGLATVAVIGGLAEAVALILFIRAALSITSENVDPFSVLGIEIGAEPGPLLTVAALSTIVAILTHSVLARGSALLSLRILTNARRRLIDGFLESSWTFQSATPDGALHEASSSLAARASYAATMLVVGAASVVILVALVGVAAIVSPTVTPGILVGLGIVLLLLRPLTSATRRRARETVSLTADLGQEIAETTSLAREYRTFGVEARQAEHLNAVSEATAASFVRTRTTNMMASFLFKDLAVLAFIAIVGVLYLVVDLRASGVTAAVLLIVRALGYAQLSYNVIQQSAEDSASVDELVHRLDEIEAARDDPGSTRASTVGTVRLDQVGYTYPDGRVALVDVGFEIPPGAAVGLAGPSGAGKTTIAELLLRLRTPTTGTITVDGVPLSDIDRHDWAGLVAFVPQDPKLTRGTIADNIAFLRDVDHDTIVAAARHAHVLDTIEALPDGFATRIGPRSQGLSGGQRQRLAIARALVGRPDLLVLDEPTSALDGESERLFRQTLAELHGTVTIVVIAHRASTLDVCDVVHTVAAGRLHPGRPASDAPVGDAPAGDAPAGDAPVGATLGAGRPDPGTVSAPTPNAPGAATAASHASTPPG
jgi:ABC-type multidrug transport system fused ATPase/permease subunit